MICNSLKVNVRQLVADEDLDDVEDECVKGIYKVEFAFDSASFTLPVKVSIALDIFHSTVAIGYLDDFEVCVVDDEGRPMEEDPNYEPYSVIWKGDVLKISDSFFNTAD